MPAAGMFRVQITEKGGAQRQMDFDKGEVTIGRIQGNDIILPKGNVSKKHSRIVLKDKRFIVVDLKSTNGTYVNGRKITSPLVVKTGDKIYIGDFIITLEEVAGDAPSSMSHGHAAPPAQPPHVSQGFGAPPPPLQAAPPVQQPPSMAPAPAVPAAMPQPPLSVPAVPGQSRALGSQPPAKITATGNHVGPPAGGGTAPTPGMGTAPLSYPPSTHTPAQVIAPSMPPVPPPPVLAPADPVQSVNPTLGARPKKITADAPDLVAAQERFRIEEEPREESSAGRRNLPARSSGVLIDLLNDSAVRSIRVENLQQILVDKGDGFVPLGGVAIGSAQEVIEVIHNLARQANVDTLSPLLEFSMADGTDVMAVLPPAAPVPFVQIHKSKLNAAGTPVSMVGRGVLPQDLWERLVRDVGARRSVLIVGPTPDSASGLGPGEFMAGLLWEQPSVSFALVTGGPELGAVSGATVRFVATQHAGLGVLAQRASRLRFQRLVIDGMLTGADLRDGLPAFLAQGLGAIGTVYTQVQGDVFDHLGVVMGSDAQLVRQAAEYVVVLSDTGGTLTVTQVVHTVGGRSETIYQR